jgi:hypothetical protein
MTSNEYIICGACEDLRDHEPYFAKEHLKNYPDYKKYTILPTETSS